jgi:hypothetical protein
MDLAECIARAMAAEQACIAPDRHSMLPAGRLRETWRDHLPEACEILVALGRSTVRTAAMMEQIELARMQLAALRPRPTLVRSEG